MLLTVEYFGADKLAAKFLISHMGVKRQPAQLAGTCRRGRYMCIFPLPPLHACTALHCTVPLPAA